VHAGAFGLVAPLGGPFLSQMPPALKPPRGFWCTRRGLMAAVGGRTHSLAMELFDARTGHVAAILLAGSAVNATEVARGN